MQRPIWKGHISFALVNIPVQLFSAEKCTELHFHMLDSRNQARVHYERINDETGQEVPWNEIVKAFEFDTNNYVVLKDEDFKRAAPKAIKTIDIEDFVDLADISYMYFDRPYYLVPEKTAEKGYVLLREALREAGKVGIAKIVIRSKQYLAAVMSHENAIMLNLLRFDQELRQPNEFELPDENLKSYHISAREITMATQLIDTMSNEWQPKKYHDEYREALMKFIEEKATKGKKRKTKVKEEAAIEDSNVIDFMQLLKKSLDQNKEEMKKTKRKAH